MWRAVVLDDDQIHATVGTEPCRDRGRVGDVNALQRDVDCVCLGPWGLTNELPAGVAAAAGRVAAIEAITAAWGPTIRARECPAPRSMQDRAFFESVVGYRPPLPLWLPG